MLLAHKLMVGTAGGGGGSGVAYLAGGDVNSIGLGVRTATLRLDTDGFVYFGDNAIFAQQYAWKITGSVGDYEAYCTVNAGSVSGTTGAWLALNSTRDWSVIDSSDDGEDQAAAITIQIRDAGTLAVLASADFDIIAFRV